MVSADLTVPSLAPLAALEKVDMRGSADFRIAVNQAGKQMKIALTSKLDTQGTAIPARLLGRNATLDMNALLDGSDMTDSHIRLHGDAITPEIANTPSTLGLTSVSGTSRRRVWTRRSIVNVGDGRKVRKVLESGHRIMRVPRRPFDAGISSPLLRVRLRCSRAWRRR